MYVPRSLRGSGLALAASVAMHASLLSLGAWLLARSLTSSPVLVGGAPAPRPIELEPELSLPEMSASGPGSEEASNLPPPLQVAQGGRHAPRPDLESAGRGGERTSREQALNLASSIDPIALERDPTTLRERSQVSRLRTAAHRASRDDRRATPNPMQLTFLATGPGHVRARRAYAPDDPARGILGGTRASRLGSKAGGDGASPSGEGEGAAPGGAVAGSDSQRIGQGTPDGREAQEFHAGARVLFARPLVPQARPAVPAQQRERPNDTQSSSQEVAARVSSLIHASSAGGEPGPGVGGQKDGGAPGAFGAAGIGSRSSPSGAGFGPDFSDDPGFSGFDGALRQQLARVLADTFPEWAIAEGRGGHIIFEMTLRADGHPLGVRVVRPSGIAEYDQNVVQAVRSVRSFGRLPAGLGAPARLRISWVALNPIIGREGPGPGGGHPRR